MKRILIIMMLFVAASCSNTDKKNNEGIVVTVDPKSEQTIVFSDFVKSIDYVKLETTKESLIGTISRIFVIDDMYVIHSGTDILCFAEDGKFLYKISRRGRGPQEYQSI